MELKLSITKEKFLKGLLIALALTPLIAVTFAMFPYVIGKTVFIRSFVALFWVSLSIILIRAKKQPSEIVSRLDLSFLKNPIFVSIFSFLFIGLISALFASNQTKAFFGTVERGEGMIQIFFLALLFAGSLIILRGKEWTQFFKLSVLVGIVLSIDSITEFIRAGGIGRPNGSFITNPAFLAAFLLFALLAAFIVLIRVRAPIWRYTAYSGIIFSIIALGITNTRGALVGLAAGIIASLVFFAFNSGKLKINILGRDLGLKTLSIGFLIFLFLLGSTFIFTIQSSVWDKIPGFNRLSEISLEDNTTQSRLVTTRTALRAIDPTNNSLRTFLIGYGQDNFNIAYNLHYDPSVQRYEELWFDRAHNKLLDVFVMQGLLGLLAYLAIWYFVIRTIFRYSKSSSEDEGERFNKTILLSGALLFYGTSYFVQNLFLFDQPANHVANFMFWVFVAHLYQKNERPSGLMKESTLRYIAPIIGVVTVYLVILYSLIPFNQTIQLVSTIRTESAITLSENLDKITLPYNYAQPEIRFRVLDIASTLVSVDGARPFIDDALRLKEEVLLEDPLEPRNFQVVGFVYDSIARLQDEPELYLVAEDHLRTAMELAPGRQEIQFLLAQNLLSQGRLEEAYDLSLEMLAAEPNAPKGRAFYTVLLAPIDWDGEHGTFDIMFDVYVDEAVIFLDLKTFTFIRNSYNSYFKHFLEQRDADSFLKTLEQALEIELFLEAAQQAQLEAGLIGETYESRAPAIRSGISAFKTGGWDAIKVE